MQPLFYQDPYFNNLILAMDIESNPGPTELKEIKENPGENNTKTKVTFHRPFLFSGLKGGVNKEFNFKEIENMRKKQNELKKQKKI